jgi:hypothetical protein
MMRVQARAQALASLLYSLSASPGFLRVHPLRIHPLSVPWPPRVQVQPSSISYMDNLLRSLQTHFLAPTCNTSRFPSYRHRIQLFFRFCHIHLQAHISTTWIGSHLGVPAKCCPGDVPKVGSTNANLNRDIQGISGDVEESGEGVAVFFGGFDSGQWYSLDFMGLQWENTVVLLTPAEGGTTLVGHKVCDPMLLPANQTMSFHHYPTGRDTTAVYPTVPQTFPNDVSRKDSKDGKYE